MPSISEAVSCPGSSARSAMQTLAASSAKRLAVSRPMPPAPPVTTATLPLRRPGMLILLRGHEDVFYLGVVVQGVRAELAPHARLLHPAKRCCDPDGSVGVYGQYAGLDAAGDAHGPGDVLRPERAGETVDRVVGEANGVLFVLEGDHGHDGAEDLLLRRPVSVVHGRQDGRRVPEPGAFGRFAPDRHGRVIGDVGGHLLAMVGGDQGSHVRGFVEGVPDPYPRDGWFHKGEKLVEDAPLDEDARAGAAVLSGVAEHGDGRGSGGLLQVGVGEDDVGGLATELQRHALYGAGRAGHDSFPDFCGTRESDLGDFGVLDESLSDLATRAYEDVDDAVWNAGLARYALELDGCEGCELGGLENERVARRERRRHFPARDGKREVPRDDEPDDAQRLAERNIHAPGDRDGVAEQALGHPGVVVEGLGYHPHLAAGITYRLARVPGFQLRQVLLFRIQGVGEAAEQSRAVGGFYVSPRRERFSGAGDNPVGVVFGGGVQALQYVFCGRVDYVKQLGNLRY